MLILVILRMDIHYEARMLLMLVYHDLFLFMVIVLTYIHALSSSSLSSSPPNSKNKPETKQNWIKKLFIWSICYTEI